MAKAHNRRVTRPAKPSRAKNVTPATVEPVTDEPETEMPSGERRNKRRAQKVYDMDGGTVTLSFEGENVPPFVAVLEDLPPDIIRRAALEGLARKLGTGLYLAEIDDPRAWAENAYQALLSGVWNAGRTAGLWDPILMEALVAVDSERRSEEDIRRMIERRIGAEIRKAGEDAKNQAVLTNHTRRILRGFKNDLVIKAKMAEIRARKAAELAAIAPPKIDNGNKTVKL